MTSSFFRVGGDERDTTDKKPNKNNRILQYMQIQGWHKFGSGVFENVRELTQFHKFVFLLLLGKKQMKNQDNIQKKRGPGKSEAPGLVSDDKNTIHRPGNPAGNHVRLLHRLPEG